VRSILDLGSLRLEFEKEGDIKMEIGGVARVLN